MQVNDIYMTTDPRFDAPAKDFRRMVIVREIRGDNVKISAVADKQPRIKSGIVIFNQSGFVLPIDRFTEHFEFLEAGQDAI